MRGAKALASEIHRRRCQTVKGRVRRVRGSFLLLPPEIVLRHEGGGANCIETGVLMHGHWLRGITPPSDVTYESTFSANAGTAEAAGVVPGAWSNSTR